MAKVGMDNSDAMSNEEMEEGKDGQEEGGVIDDEGEREEDEVAAAANDDDDDDDEDEDEEELEERVKSAQEAVKHAEWSYEAHAELVNVLRLAGEFEELFTAREEMSRRFPLPPELWLTWTEDLRKVGDWKRALAVAQRASGDYLSVPVLLKQMELAVDAHRGGQMDAESVRNLFEEAVNMGGSVYRDGIEIWRSYRSFERSCANLPENKFSEKEVALLKRQFSLPLRGSIDDVQYVKSIDESLLDEVKDRIQAAGQLASELEPLEEKLIQHEKSMTGPGAATDTLWFSWKSLIALEVETKDPCRVKVAYERAISCCFLRLEPWTEYSSFIYDTLKDKALRANVLYRAVRNCSWSEDLWCECMRAWEANDADKIKMLELFNQAKEHAKLNNLPGLDLSLGLLQYLRRKLSADDLPQILEEAHSIQEEGSPAWCTVSLLASRILMMAGQISPAKEILEYVLQKRGTEAYWWVEYANELHKRDLHDDSRHLLRRGSFVVTPLEEMNVLGSAWMDIEVISGSLEQYYLAKDRIAEQQKVLFDRKRRFEDKGGQRRKRARIAQENVWGEGESRNAVHSTGASTSRGKEKGENHMDTEKKQHGAKPNKKPDPKKKNEVEANTVFVSNLDFSLSKEQLREAFVDIPGLKDVRLIIRQSDGASKGYGYVEFENDEGVAEAVKMHLSSLHGRPIHVKRSNPGAPPTTLNSRGGGRPRPGRPKNFNAMETDKQKGGFASKPKSHIVNRHMPHKALQINAKSLIPASVPRRQKTGVEKTSTTMNGSNEPEAMETEKPPRNNFTQDDFRKLLGKKP